MYDLEKNGQILHLLINSTKLKKNMHVKMLKNYLRKLISKVEEQDNSLNTIADSITIIISQIYCFHLYLCKKIKLSAPRYYHNIDIILNCDNGTNFLIEKIRPLLDDNKKIEKIIAENVIPSLDILYEHYNNSINLLRASSKYSASYEVTGNSFTFGTPIFFLETISKILINVTVIDQHIHNIYLAIDILENIVSLNSEKIELRGTEEYLVSAMYYLIKYFGYKIDKITDPNKFPHKIATKDIENIIKNESYALYLYNIIV